MSLRFTLIDMGSRSLPWLILRGSQHIAIENSFLHYFHNLAPPISSLLLSLSLSLSCLLTLAVSLPILLLISDKYVVHRSNSIPCLPVFPHIQIVTYSEYCTEVIKLLFQFFLCPYKDENKDMILHILNSTTRIIFEG